MTLAGAAPAAVTSHGQLLQPFVYHVVKDPYGLSQTCLFSRALCTRVIGNIEDNTYLEDVSCKLGITLTKFTLSQFSLVETSGLIYLSRRNEIKDINEKDITRR